MTIEKKLFVMRSWSVQVKPKHQDFKYILESSSYQINQGGSYLTIKGILPTVVKISGKFCLFSLHCHDNGGGKNFLCSNNAS